MFIQFDASFKLHKDNPNKDYYIIFIKFDKEKLSSFKSTIKGIEITPAHYSKFSDYELIQKEFEITNDEVNNDLGITGAVYNRIALKDLK